MLLQFGDTFFSLLQFAPKTRVTHSNNMYLGFSIFAIKKSWVLPPQCYKIKQKALNIPPSLKLSGVSFFLNASLFAEDRFHLIMCPPDTLKTFCQCIINILATHFSFDSSCKTANLKKNLNFFFGYIYIYI